LKAGAAADDIPTDRTPIYQRMRSNWAYSCSDMRRNPRKYLTIPVVAALVGYITNYVGVKMLFYPTSWTGIPLKLWPEQPFGLIGWQGIVPCKRYIMSTKMVDVTISRLLNVKEVFNRLEPRELSRILQKDVKASIFFGWLPSPLVRYFLRRASGAVLRDIENVVDVKGLVMNGLCSDQSTLSTMFQKVAQAELRFLVNSGFVFGFILGLLQMLQWMIFPSNWTLLAGGSIVGYVTNWIALKWVFEPLNPTKIGPFVLQGMFLRRQREVSADFSAFIAQNVLTSRNVWAQMVADAPFADIIGRSVPLPRRSIDKIVASLRDKVVPATGISTSGAALHVYTTARLDLQTTLTAAMNKLSTAEFEKVLHPVFQEDELTLILAGAVLGAFTGGVQWLFNVWEERQKTRPKRGVGGIQDRGVPI
jgi:uncharacterized membrane protein YheB (UPF0754 family)